MFVDISDFNTCGCYFSVMDGYNHDVFASPSDDYAKFDELPRSTFFDYPCSLPRAVCEGVFSTYSISN